MVGIVSVGKVVVGVSGEGLEVEFAGGGEDAGGDFTSGELGMSSCLFFVVIGSNGCVYYLLTTKTRFLGCGGIVADIVAVAINGLRCLRLVVGVLYVVNRTTCPCGMCPLVVET